MGQGAVGTHLEVTQTHQQYWEGYGLRNKTSEFSKGRLQLLLLEFRNLSHLQLNLFLSNL